MIANLVGSTNFSDFLKRFDFNISATVLGGASSPLYEMDIYPLTKGMINSVYYKCASSTYTVSLYDVVGNYPIVKDSAINLEHIESNTGAMFYNSESLLYCLLDNTDTGNATGVITISIVAQGQH
jgi:hypothetical protein